MSKDFLSPISFSIQGSINYNSKQMFSPIINIVHHTIMTSLCAYDVPIFFPFSPIDHISLNSKRACVIRSFFSKKIC